MLYKTFFILIVGIGLSSATYTLIAGTCQTFELYLASANVSYNETICAQNATATVVSGSCPAATRTAWANSTIEVNNATIQCLANHTEVNVTEYKIICNYSRNFTPSAIPQYEIDAKKELYVVVNAIPFDYCYENKYQVASTPTYFQSAKCNSTFFCNASNIACPACAACPNVTCPVTACDVCQPESVLCANVSMRFAACNVQMENLNATIWGAGGYEERVKQENDKVTQLQQNTNWMQSQIEAKVKEETGGIYTIIQYLIIGVGLGAVFWLGMKSKSGGNEGVQRAMTADSLADLRKTRENGKN